MLESICRELGVEIGEKWLGNDGYKYRISENGEIFIYDESGFYTGRQIDRWKSIIKKELKPIWKPKIGDRYYIPDIARDEDNRYNWCEWHNDERKMDDWYLSKGLVFKTKEEAIEATNKMMEILWALRLNKM